MDNITYALQKTYQLKQFIGEISRTIGKLETLVYECQVALVPNATLLSLPVTRIKRTLPDQLSYLDKLLLESIKVQGGIHE